MALALIAGVISEVSVPSLLLWLSCELGSCAPEHRGSVGVKRIVTGGRHTGIIDFLLFFFFFNAPVSPFPRAAIKTN